MKKKMLAATLLMGLLAAYKLLVSRLVATAMLMHSSLLFHVLFFIFRFCLFGFDIKNASPTGGKHLCFE